MLREEAVFSSSIDNPYQKIQIRRPKVAFQSTGESNEMRSFVDNTHISCLLVSDTYLDVFAKRCAHSNSTEPERKEGQTKGVRRNNYQEQGSGEGCGEPIDVPFNTCAT